MKIKIRIISVLLLLPIISFGQGFKLDYDSKKIQKEIRLVAKKMGEKNVIHDEAIGFAGEKTSQYHRFEKLVKKATIDELVELMKHPKPAVRGYVFWALAKRQYEDLEAIFIKHANDDESVFLMQGCTGGDMPVIEFMRWVVTPKMIDLECKKLDKIAIKKMTDKQHIFDEEKN